MKTQNLKKGQKVFFIGEKLPMTVNEVNQKYAICTRSLHRREDAELIKYEAKESLKSFTQCFNELKNDIVYSILDLINNVKAPHNSWGYGIEKETLEDDVKEIMKALMSGEIELSRRNSCDLNIDLNLTFTN